MKELNGEKVMRILRRALNLIDERLVDHGLHVMLVMNDMLDAEGCADPELRKDLSILALLHDVGAYRTEEINNLVQFETGNVWAHSIYGYLFLKEFTPLGKRAEIVLYHHADYKDEIREPEEILHYAQLMHTADRAVVWHDAVKRPKEYLKRHLTEMAGRVFSPESVELFWKAEDQRHTLSRLDGPMQLEGLMDCSRIGPEEAAAYLNMAVHSIDFRSRVTMTHTVSVREIGIRLAEKMNLPQEVQEQIGYGALLHDLGKIGTPLSILEKPGRLTDDEMAVMRHHVTLGREIIGGCVDDTVAEIALRHHEKLDGSGYPLGLTAAELTLPQRILAVADIASALCMRRSYKEAFPKERSLGILREMAEKGQLDRTAVGTLDACFDEIIYQANAACEPVKETYERMSQTYRALLNTHNQC